MAAHKGHPKYGGRPPGGANKTTSEVRAAYQKLVENNIENFEKWIKDIAKEDPFKAMDLMIKISEYFIPKLARTENKHEFEEQIEGFKIVIKRNRDDS